METWANIIGWGGQGAEKIIYVRGRFGTHGIYLFLHIVFGVGGGGGNSS